MGTKNFYAAQNAPSRRDPPPGRLRAPRRGLTPQRHGAQRPPRPPRTAGPGPAASRSPRCRAPSGAGRAPEAERRGPPLPGSKRRAARPGRTRGYWGGGGSVWRREDGDGEEGKGKGSGGRRPAASPSALWPRSPAGRSPRGPPLPPRPPPSWSLFNDAPCAAFWDDAAAQPIPGAARRGPGAEAKRRRRRRQRDRRPPARARRTRPPPLRAFLPPPPDRLRGGLRARGAPGAEPPLRRRLEAAAAPRERARGCGCRSWWGMENVGCDFPKL